MKRVLIINEGYSHNLGDQAILEASSRYYKDHGYEVDFLYLSKPNIKKLPKYDYKSLVLKRVKKNNLLFKLKASLIFFHWFLANRKTIISTLKSNNYAIISIGGGQLINTSGTNLPSAFAIALFWFTYLIKKYAKESKLYFVAIGLATRFNKIERKLYQQALHRADDIWVRDEFSQQTINKIYKINAKLIPDIAFYISKNGQTPVKTELALVGIASFEEVVLKYNNGITKDAYFGEIFEEIKLIERRGLNVKLFYTTLLDVTAIKEYNSYLMAKNIEPYEICEIQDLGGLIEELKVANLVYSGRMHGLILGLKYGCEIKPYLISQKLKSFNEAYIVKNRAIHEISSQIELGLATILKQ